MFHSTPLWSTRTLKLVQEESRGSQGGLSGNDPHLRNLPLRSPGTLRAARAAEVAADG